MPYDQYGNRYDPSTGGKPVDAFGGARRENPLYYDDRTGIYVDNEAQAQHIVGPGQIVTGRSLKEALRSREGAARARAHNEREAARRTQQTMKEANMRETPQTYVGNELVAQGSPEHIEAMLRTLGAVPGDMRTTDPSQMTEVERANAAVQGLAMIAAAASANLAAAQQKETERGSEPPIGSTVRFSKRFGGTKPYNFSAISVAKEHNHRRWHHTGTAQFGAGLPNPCSWEELNEFATKGTVEVGMSWVLGPKWREELDAESADSGILSPEDAKAVAEPQAEVSPDADLLAKNTELRAEVNDLQTRVTMLSELVSEADDQLSSAASPGVRISKSGTQRFYRGWQRKFSDYMRVVRDQKAAQKSRT